MKDNNDTQNTIDCELNLCIYNKDKKCISNSIQIMFTGSCESCIIPDFPDEIIETYKKNLLEKLNR